MKKTIHFKSTPGNYMKEKSGVKPNTVRFTDDWDKKRWNEFWDAEHICLTNTVSLESFTREITDKTVYKNIAIISYHHPV